MHPGLGYVNVEGVEGDVGVAFYDHGTGPVLDAKFGVGNAAIEDFSGGDVLGVDGGGGTEGDTNSYPQDEDAANQG